MKCKWDNSWKVLEKGVHELACSIHELLSFNYSWNNNLSISRTVHELNLSWMVHEFFVTRICCLICTSCSGHELFMMTSWWTFHEQRFMISWTFHEFEFMPLRNCSTLEVHMQYRSSPKSQHTISTAPAVLQVCCITFKWKNINQCKSIPAARFKYVN